MELQNEPGTLLSTVAFEGPGTQTLDGKQDRGDANGQQLRSDAAMASGAFAATESGVMLPRSETIRRGRTTSLASEKFGDRKDDAALLSDSHHGVTLRKIFDEEDTEKLGFLTPVQAHRALSLVGVTLTLSDMDVLLDEIDVNQASGTVTTSKSFHFSDLLDMDSDKEDDADEQKDEHRKAKQNSGGSLKQQRILFEDFEKLIFLWQSAARFQLFEKRSDEMISHLEATVKRNYLATDSLQMWAWQCVMLFCSAYLVMVPVAIFTNTEAEIAQYLALYTPTDAIVTVVLLADMILKTCCCVSTTVSGINVVLDDWKSIARHYVRSPWFLIDLAVVVPWRFVFFAGGNTDYLMKYNNVTRLIVDPHNSGCIGCTTIEDYRLNADAATFFLLLRALKFIEHYRYFEETGLTPLSWWYIWRNYVVGMGLLQLTRFVLLAHTLAVIFLSIDKWSSRQDTAGMETGTKRYAEALYLVLYCMATVGYGDVPPVDNPQRFYFMVLIIAGWLFNAYIIGSLVGFFSTSDIETSRQSKLLELSTLLSHFDVPKALELEIVSFENYLLTHAITKSFGHVVNDLPADMQRNLELWNRVKVVSSISLFSDFHKSAKLQICNALIEVTFCPEDYVYLIGEIGTEMFFVNHGFVDILDYDSNLIETKKGGEFFGEVGAFQADSMKRSEDAKCLTYCEFFVLDNTAFIEVQKRYPRVQRMVETYWASRAGGEQSKLDMAMSIRNVDYFSSMLPPRQATAEGEGAVPLLHVEEPQQEPIPVGSTWSLGDPNQNSFASLIQEAEAEGAIPAIPEQAPNPVVDAQVATELTTIPEPQEQSVLAPATRRDSFGGRARSPDFGLDGEDMRSVTSSIAGSVCDAPLQRPSHTVFDTPPCGSLSRLDSRSALQKRMKQQNRRQGRPVPMEMLNSALCVSHSESRSTATPLTSQSPPHSASPSFTSPTVPRALTARASPQRDAASQPNPTREVKVAQSLLMPTNMEQRAPSAASTPSQHDGIEPPQRRTGRVQFRESPQQSMLLGSSPPARFLNTSGLLQGDLEVEADWDNIRFEVGHMGHAALVDVVLQCLGEAYSMHELLARVEGK